VAIGEGAVWVADTGAGTAHAARDGRAALSAAEVSAREAGVR
jgi:hypothetical protein